VGEPQVTDFTIRLEVAGMSIAAVYLPPALSAHEVKSTLDSLPVAHFTVRLARPSGQSGSIPLFHTDGWLHYSTAR
jgi:hypothetical protein